jgi:dienelactone hydrolase
VTPTLLSVALSLVAASPAQTSGASQVIDIKAPDGVILKATYYPAAKPGPAVMLFHACNRDRSAWKAFAEEAAGRGFHVLALDFRGYGESRGSRGDNELQQTWIASREWPADIDAAWTWLMSQRGVDKTRAAAAGASCGVNPAVQLARRHPEVRTVVLLSGGLTPETREFLRDSPGLPIFASASRGDAGIVDTLRWAVGWSRNPANTFVEYKAAGHGTDMFAVEKDLPPQILKWLETNVRDAPAGTPAAAPAAKPTDVEVFWTTVNAPGGIEKARKLYDEARARDKTVVLFPEGEMNQLGYRLLQTGSAQDAVTVFQMNVEAYPNSANTYDSLSDAYLAMGKKQEALDYARKTLDALAADRETPEEFKKLIKDGAEKKLKEIK